MNSKIILLFGGVFSSIVVFFCLKNQYITTQQTVQKALKIKQINLNLAKKTKSVQKILEEPSLSFNLNKNISIKINKNQQKIFETIINILDKNYSKNIIFKNNIKKSIWSNLAVKSIKYLQEQNITNAKIKAYSRNIKIYAIFKNKTKYNNFTNLIKNLENNKTIIENHVKLKINTKKLQVKKKETINISNFQNEINKLLKNKPLYFKFALDILTVQSKKTLDSIIKILKSNNIKYDISIYGHTDAQGNETYNKKLSQKRANTVKKYILSHTKNIQKINAEGFGSKKPKYKNKKDKRNRRVEIIINKGFK